MTEQQRCAIGAAGQSAACEKTNQFQREDRYIVIKHKDLIEADKSGKVAAVIFDALSALSEILPHRDYVVIESDWPEYETVWRMIEARVAGHQAGGAQAGRAAFAAYIKECAANEITPDAAGAFTWAWIARAATAQSFLNCAKCGGTGGNHPWGEAAMVPCDCAHTEGAQGELEEWPQELRDCASALHKLFDRDCRVLDRALELPCENHDQAYNYMLQAREIADVAKAFLSRHPYQPQARAAMAQPSPAPELDQLYSMLGVTDQVQAGERIGFLVGQSIMVPKLEAQLKRGTVYVEARQCDECQHGGINDSADGLAACHDCDWTGPDPLEDKCPGCQSENCMAAACPQCGARYVLVASEEMAAPVAQAGQVPDLERALAGMLFAFDDGVGQEWSADLLDFARKLVKAKEFVDAPAQGGSTDE